MHSSLLSSRLLELHYHTRGSSHHHHRQHNLLNILTSTPSPPTTPPTQPQPPYFKPHILTSPSLPSPPPTSKQLFTLTHAHLNIIHTTITTYIPQRIFHRLFGSYTVFFLTISLTHVDPHTHIPPYVHTRVFHPPFILRFTHHNFLSLLSYPTHQ